MDKNVKTNILWHITRGAAIVLGIFAVLEGIYIVGIKKENATKDTSIVNTTPEIVDVKLLKTQLVESSELTTAKQYMTFYSEFKDTGITFLNRSDFVMVFDAEIRAGINLADVAIPEDKVDYDNKIIYISIPKATLQGDPAVDPETIKYFDEHFSLFNVDEKEDANRAQALAQEEAKKQAVSSGILEMADKQSEALVIGLLSQMEGTTGYSIQVLKDDR